MADPPVQPVARPERLRAVPDREPQRIAQKRLSPWARAYGTPALRKIALLAVLALVWQIYAAHLRNPLMLPTFAATVQALYHALFHGLLPVQIANSLEVLMMGYASGLALAVVLVVIAMSSRIGNDLLETLTSMFNPLPAIALLPLALLWFGLGAGSIVFVLIHSVLWSVALNTHSGFKSVSTTLRMVGRNYGLRGTGYIFKILIPAASGSIITGLKIGWAFAWRTLIAAELVFGVSTGAGGLGWFIYENKNELNIAAVFGGLFTVIIIGLAVENLIFRTLENHTVRKWGMQM